MLIVINESFSKVEWEGMFQGNSVNTNWNELKNKISNSKRKCSSQESETHEEQTPKVE